jgi:MscS family membrane protein
MKSFQNIIRNVMPIWEKVKVSGFTRDIHRELQDFRIDAMHCLDLSQVPEGLKRDRGTESIVLLAEVLSRIELPPYHEIPDSGAMEFKSIFTWRIPHTEIKISLIEEGSRRGEYLFTSETVARLREFFSRVRDLPYQPGAPLKKIGRAGGLYEYYISSPRGVVPIGLIESLPPWARKVYLDHALWQWMGIILTLLIGFLIVTLIHVLVRWLTKSRAKGDLRRSLIRLIVPLAAGLMVLIVDYIIYEHIGMTGKVYAVAEVSFWALSLIFAMWLVMALGGFIADAVIASPWIDPKGIHAGLTKLICNLIALLVAATILFSGISQLGISLVALLTGLGVGGFAVALAARPTIENLIGGIMILADRPYRVGQRIVVRGYDGIVQQIGLRSTKIRLLKGPHVIIPNEEMARAEIENVSRRQYIRRSSSITIEYCTPPEKVEKAVDIIKDILEDHEGVDPKRPPRVYFTEFNPDSLNISMMYWYHPAKLWKSKEFSQTINLKIMHEFNKEGIKFAYPTTTTYLTQEDDQPLQFTPIKEVSSS